MNMRTFGSFRIEVDVDGLYADEGCQKIQDAVNSFTGFDAHVGPHYSAGGWKEKQYMQPQPLGVCVSGRVFPATGHAGAPLGGDAAAKHVPLNANEKWSGVATVKSRWSYGFDPLIGI